MTSGVDALRAAGEALLSRREALERQIVRDFRGTRAALVVQAAQVERQRERLRVELLRIVHEVDEPEERDEEGYADEEAEGEETEGFYAARERLVTRDRELLGAIEALRRRAIELGKAKSPPPKLTALERELEQLETELRQWRGRCRHAGHLLDLPRYDEYASSSEAD